MTTHNGINRWYADKAMYNAKKIARDYGVPAHCLEGLTTEQQERIASTVSGHRFLWILTHEGCTALIARIDKATGTVSGMTRYHDIDDAAEMWSTLALAVEDSK